MSAVRRTRAGQAQTLLPGPIRGAGIRNRPGRAARRRKLSSSGRVADQRHQPQPHGMLTLSLLSAFLPRIFRVEGVTMVNNYGLNKVRFPAPVPAGARLRATSRLTAVKPLDGAVQAELSTTIEIEHGAKPACVAESVLRYGVP